MKRQILISLFALSFIMLINAQSIYLPNGAGGIGYNTTNSYVGIGTSAPNGTLQVSSYRPIIMKYNGGSGVYGSEIGFNAILNTGQVPNKFIKLGGTGQNGGASIITDYYGNMSFQMYNAGTENESIIDLAPQITFQNNGNIGIGTAGPNSWFEGKILEIKDNRPILKLNSSSILNTITFTNVSINATNHYGEFHLNHEFNPTDNTKSLLRFGSYPSGDILCLRSDGNIGIGITNPSVKLEVKSTILINNPQSRGASFLKLQRGPEGLDNATISFGQGGTYNWHTGLLYDGGGSSTSFYISQASEIHSGTGSLTHMPELTIASNGHIGIGTNSPAYKLDVCGTIRAKEIKVDLQGGCDFVFKNDYKLMDLNELETFVKTNQHLPEISSEKEMVENGVNMNELQMKLLQKIEELTLYTIEQNTINKQQSQVIRELQQLIKLQNEKIEKLEAVLK